VEFWIGRQTSLQSRAKSVVQNVSHYLYELLSTAQYGELKERIKKHILNNRFGPRLKFSFLPVTINRKQDGAIKTFFFVVDELE
jgi:hypothetical protein